MQEIAKKELDGVKKQHEQTEAEIKTMQTSAEDMQKLYKEQDELLGMFFSPSLLCLGERLKCIKENSVERLKIFFIPP